MDFTKPHIYRRQIVKTGKYYVGKHNGKQGKKYKGSGKDWIIDYKTYVKDPEKDILVEILEYVEDISKLNEREVYWLEYLDVVNNPLYYNLTNKTCGLNKLSQDTKNKISKALKGRKITWENHGSKGYKYTEEQKLKMKKPRINKWVRDKLISPGLVEEIRQKHNTGNYTRSSLSREYGVSWGTIKNITDKINSYKDI